jgi:aminocarboxymuconate-semialdehyde decarboxylase
MNNNNPTPRVPDGSRRDFLKIGAAATALTALKPGSARAQARQPGSIDAHAHWAPEAYIKFVQDLGQYPRIPGKPLDPKLYDIKARAQWMDSRGVQMHLLTLSGSMPWQWAKPGEAPKLAQIVNDAGVEAHLAMPDRFIAGIAVPIRDPAAAIAELNRMAGKPGVRAVGLPNSIEGKDYLFAPEYEPFIARCEELGYPLVFHPLDGALNSYAGTRLAGANFTYNTLGFPFDSATTATQLVFSGLLDRFPKLDVVLPHSGGCFPYIVGRIEHSVRKGATAAKLRYSMREYMRRFHYDSLAYFPETLRFMIDLLGSDRIVIGTDNYATMDVDQPNALVEQLNLPAADRDRILSGNAKKLFKI